MSLSSKLFSTSAIVTYIGASAMVLAPSTALAQIDEIVTTAQRRSESVQDVPVSVTVISGADLETKQITDTLDVQNFVPNFNIGTNTGTSNAPRLFLRGIGEDESRGAVEPAVGTYVDGVYFGRLVGSLFDLVDLEQIEVLRGPQGTLYGRNSNGGALKITTVKPQQETSLSGRLTYGNLGRLEGKATGNYALTDTTAVRVSGIYKTRDGYIDVTPNGDLADTARTKVGDVDTKAIRATLSQDVGNWNVLIAADYTKDNSEPTPNSVIDDVDRDGNIFTVEPPVGTTCSSFAPGQFRGVGCFAEFSNETESQGISATISGELGGFDVQSITSFRTLDDDLQSQIGSRYFQETDQEQFSQEVTFSSNFDGAFNFVAGGFYFKEDLNLDTIFFFPSLVASDTESFAVFGQGEFEITDRATLTGGVRYTTEDREFAGINFGLETATGGAGLFTDADETSFDKVSYTGKLDYELSDDVLVYGSYSTGFKGAGFSPDCFAPAACYLPVDEEEVKTIEVGVKTRIWDDRLQFNATYFNNQYDNLQIAATVPGLGFTRFNVDETATKGFEFDLRFKPTDRFEFIANLGLLDAEYQSVTAAQAGALTNCGNPCPLADDVVIANALDLELKNAPEYKANLAAIYTQPLASGEMQFSGDISFEDDSFNLVANAPFNARTDVPALINSRIAYTPDSGFWTIGLWAKNLSDETYFRASSAANNVVYPSEPRTYGVDLGFNF